MRKLDSYDVAILRTLQREGRITKAALAKAVNLSASPCWERLRRLEEDGFITGYRADLDVRMIASVTEVIVEITLANHQGEDFKRFEDAIAGMPAVIECNATGGGIDYIMKLLVRDVDAYQRLMDRMLDDDLGIDRYFGYIVTKAVKSEPPDIGTLLERV